MITPSPSILDFADKNVFYLYTPKSILQVSVQFGHLKTFKKLNHSVHVIKGAFLPEIAFVKFFCVVAYSSSLFLLLYRENFMVRINE